jgi:single-strand DNA-binding protein
MRDLNEVRLRGRLGQDAEKRQLEGGKAVTVLNLAPSIRYKDRQSGEWKDGSTEWHRCTVWGPKAEKAAALKKSDRIQVTGRLRSSEYTPSEEATARRSWEVVVSELVRVEQVGAGGGDDEPVEEPEDTIPF